MAQPKRIDELTASGSLSAGAAVAIVQGGVTVRTTPRAFITEAESFTQSGSGAVEDTVANELKRHRISPFQFMTSAQRADVESLSPTLDMATVLSTAAVRAAAQGKYVDLGGYTWLLGSQLSISTNGVKFWLGGATIKKGFSGDIITVSGTDFALDGTGVVDGQHGTYTGKGVLFTGSSHRPYFSAGISFTSFTDTHIQFASDSGQQASIYCTFRPGSGQTDFRAVHCLGTDTIACYRKIIGSITVGGYHDLDGAWNTIIDASAFRRVEIDSNCSITSVLGSVWGNSDVAMTISGANNMILGNRFSGNVTLDSNFSGVFGAPRFTSGKLINNSAVAVIVGDRQPLAILASTGVPVAVTNTTSEEALATIDVPGGLLRANDALKVTAYFSWTNGADDKTPRIRFGADGAGLGGTIGFSHVATTSAGGKCELLIQNLNATGTQRLFGDVVTTAALLTNITSSSIDTTADAEIVISGQKETGTDTMTLLTYKVEIIRAQ